jgi:glycosyltransferase involved in cell wall biosynthesis
VIVARPFPESSSSREHSVSVIIPCRNEEGNIEAAVKRLPQLGKETEMIFCDDKSTDGTRAEVERMMREYPDKNIRLVDGPGICKAKNVWTGFDAAKNDILLILDADLAVMPEDMPRFVEALAGNSGEFINGSRLVYPVPRAAMKMFNRMGNIAFSWLFSMLLGQRIKDTLCGTKVLWRRDWLRMRKYVDYWGVSDRWGDYDLLLGAAKLNLRILDLPVHYQERIAGVSKMTRVLHNARIMLVIMWNAAVKMRRYGH